MHQSDALDVAEAVDRIDQAAARVRRQVDLRHVAGDDDLRPVAHAGQEHLHLGHGGVLALVEDDCRTIQRSTPHVRQRAYLDDVVLHVALDLLRFHQVVRGDVVSKARSL